MRRYVWNPSAGGGAPEMSAVYEYGPFGEPLRATGPLAKANPVRFSSELLDTATGCYYYGYRYYNPDTGRWLSRDPIGELGGVNEYGFIGNNALTRRDYLGLKMYTYPDDLLHNKMSISNAVEQLLKDRWKLREQHSDAAQQSWDPSKYEPKKGGDYDNPATGKYEGSCKNIATKVADLIDLLLSRHAASDPGSGRVQYAKTGMIYRWAFARDENEEGSRRDHEAVVLELPKSIRVFVDECDPARPKVEIDGTGKEMVVPIYSNGEALRVQALSENWNVADGFNQRLPKTKVRSWIMGPPWKWKIRE